MLLTELLHLLSGKTTRLNKTTFRASQIQKMIVLQLTFSTNWTFPVGRRDYLAYLKDIIPGVFFLFRELLLLKFSHLLFAPKFIQMQGVV